MEKRTITKEIFVSSDGKEFNNEYLCTIYEEELEINLERKKFLEETIAKLLDNNTKEIKVVITDLLSCKGKFNGTNTKLYFKGNNDNFYEFDENFFLEKEFEAVYKEVLIKYGFDMSIPYYYYCK